MKIKHAILTAALTIPLATSLAWAEGYKDKNQTDDQAGQQQGQAGQAAGFEQLDADGDGYLTEDELNIHGSTAAGQSSGAETSMKSRKMMQDRDKNQDGLISEEEFKGEQEVGE